MRAAIFTRNSLIVNQGLTVGHEFERTDPPFFCSREQCLEASTCVVAPSAAVAVDAVVGSLTGSSARLGMTST